VAQQRVMQKFAAYIKLARIHQYVKNGFVWLPIFFGNKLNDPEAIVRTFWAFVAFCLTASAVYVLNDLKDVQEDRQHPVKKFRPLASGALSRSEGILFLIILLCISASISSIILNKNVLIILAVYLFLNFVYSFKLKHISIIDIICVSTGFVLRVFAGGMASKVWISPWLVLMVFLLALFIALAKRRDDLLLVSPRHNPRKCIDSYNLEFVNLSLVAMAAVIIVTYILYTLSPEIIDKHGTNKLYFTTLWVIIGLLRYMQITFVDQKSWSPTLIVLKDIFMQVVIILWLLHFFLLLYVSRGA
jgi:4-hydroxybenzoate polyprenyltransferase